MVEIAILFLVLVLFYMLIKGKVVQRYVAEEHHYTLRKRFFSDSEQAIYLALNEAVQDTAVIHAKVSLSQLVHVKESNSKKFARAYARALKATLDFVVVERQSGKVVCGLVIDDGKKLSKQKAEREQNIVSICRKANLPLVSVNHQHSYRVNALRLKLSPYLQLETEVDNARFCQKCGSPLVVRTATQGDLIGRRFWVCSRAPNCNYIENIIEPK